jgi:GT2 family glycosyltransferase
MGSLLHPISTGSRWLVGRVATGTRLLFPFWLRRRLIPVQYLVVRLRDRYISPGFYWRLKRYDPTTQPEVSIMLITWNRLRMMSQGFQSLMEKTKGVDYEVIAWDNGSTDGTAEFLDEMAAKYPQVRVIHHPENVGLNGVCLSVKAARGYYVIKLDDDVMSFPDEWLPRLLDAYKRVPECGYMACNVVQDELTTGEKEPPQNYTAVDHNGVVLEHGPTWGWCTMTSLDVLSKVGNFPRRRGRRWFGEDLDFVRRCLRAGYTPAILRDVVVYHASGPAINEKYGYLQECVKKYEETAYAPHHIRVIERYFERQGSEKE